MFEAGEDALHGGVFFFRLCEGLRREVSRRSCRGGAGLLCLALFGPRAELGINILRLCVRANPLPSSLNGTSCYDYCTVKTRVEHRGDQVVTSSLRLKCRHTCSWPIELYSRCMSRVSWSQRLSGNGLPAGSKRQRSLVRGKSYSLPSLSLAFARKIQYITRRETAQKCGDTVTRSGGRDEDVGACGRGVSLSSMFSKVIEGARGFESEFVSLMAEFLCVLMWRRRLNVVCIQ